MDQVRAKQKAGSIIRYIPISVFRVLLESHLSYFVNCICLSNRSKYAQKQIYPTESSKELLTDIETRDDNGKGGAAIMVTKSSKTNVYTDKPIEAVEQNSADEAAEREAEMDARLKTQEMV